MRRYQLSAFSYQQRGRRGAFISAGLVGILASVAVTAGVVLQPIGEAAERQPTTQGVVDSGIRFEAIDVYIDTLGKPLAAYQFVLKAQTGQVAIVGIEGGEHAAFAEPPYYDPKAMQHDRVIIAAFNTGSDLPTGKTRIARVHVQITGDVEPTYEQVLQVAATSDSNPIANATASIITGVTQ